MHRGKSLGNKFCDWHIFGAQMCYFTFNCNIVFIFQFLHSFGPFSVFIQKSIEKTQVVSKQREIHLLKKRKHIVKNYRKFALEKIIEQCRTGKNTSKRTERKKTEKKTARRTEGERKRINGNKLNLDTWLEKRMCLFCWAKCLNQAFIIHMCI